MPDAISVEESFPMEFREDLESRGHVVRQRPSQGDRHAIWIDPKTAARHPGIDCRVRGAAYAE